MSIGGWAGTTVRGLRGNVSSTPPPQVSKLLLELLRYPSNYYLGKVVIPIQVRFDPESTKNVFYESSESESAL